MNDSSKAIQFGHSTTGVTFSQSKMMNFPPHLNLTTTPLTRPPPGVKSNFEHPSESRGDQYRPIIICFTILGSTFVLIRLYTRIWITRHVGADDCSTASVFVRPFK